MTKKLKKRLKKIISGAVLFAIAIVLTEVIPLFADNIIGLLLFLAAYFVIGGDVVKKACTNILKGQVFDENFLMLIASIMEMELVSAANNTRIKKAAPIICPNGIASNTLGRVLNIKPAPALCKPSSPLNM